jgi:hypothetical protein
MYFNGFVTVIQLSLFPKFRRAPLIILRTKIQEVCQMIEPRFGFCVYLTARFQGPVYVELIRETGTTGLNPTHISTRWLLQCKPSLGKHLVPAADIRPDVFHNAIISVPFIDASRI